MATTSTRQTAQNENLIAGWLTQDEFSILEAVCETLLPSLEPPEGSSEVSCGLLSSIRSRCERCARCR